jgi:hypothetical protein
MIGKSIRIFLVDGSPTGLMTAEIGQWTGKALVCPRQSLAKLGARDEAKRPGVYVLLGTDPDRPGRERVYIGEAENVYDRLKQHDSDEKKDWWSRVCLFAASDGSLTKAHIKYLESRLVELARQTGRSLLENGNTPPRPALPESDTADMETFITQALILLPVVGFRFSQAVLEGKEQASGAASSEPARFVFETKGAKAFALATDDAFVVTKGSTASNQDMSSWTQKRLRDALVAEEALIPHPTDNTLYVFADNVPFPSPSAASEVIRAGGCNGRVAWKLEGTGQTYGQWQEDRQREMEAKG